MSRRRSALLVLAALGWSVLFLGTRPLADPDEGRYGEASREMLVARNPWYPTLDGRPHLTKPPLTYWLSAAGMGLFGQNEWGARAGLALAFTTSIVAAFALGRRWGGDARTGTGAALALATSLLPFAAASVLSTDAVLAAAEAVAIACAARALTDPASRRAAVRWMWLALGAAFLTKGPPGLLPLAGVALAWPLRAGPRTGERWIDAVSAVLFAVVGLGWYAAMIVDDPSRLRMFLGAEVIDRVFTNRFNRAGPVWLPLLTLVGGALPWAPWGLAALREPPAVDGGRALRRLLVGWILAGLVRLHAEHEPDAVLYRPADPRDRGSCRGERCAAFRVRGPRRGAPPASRWWSCWRPCWRSCAGSPSDSRRASRTRPTWRAWRGRS